MMAATTVQSAQQGLRQFLAWWAGELRALVPVRLTARLQPPAPTLIVGWQDGALAIAQPIGDGWRKLCRLAAGAGAADRLGAALAAIPGAPDPAVARIVLALDSDLCLRKRVLLPLAAADNLAEVLTLDMDRQCPFPPDQVVFDHRLVRRDREHQRVEVDLVIVPRAVIDAASGPLAAFGLVPEAVYALTEAGEVVARIPLLPGRAASREGALPRRVSKVLAGLALGLLIAVIVVPWQRQRVAADRLATEIAAARAEAETVRQMQGEIERILGQGRFVYGRKAERPPVIEIIDEVARILPDDAWLFRLRILDREVQAFGYSPAASTLIGPIQDAPLFTNAQFRAPLMRDPNIDAERFHLAFEVADTKAESR
jgi:general secretion pathway protein L